MENQLQLFNFENQQVRTLLIDEKPYFVGNDVSKILGYTDYRHAVINHVDEEDKLRVQINHAGQMRKVTVINESGLYSLILSSKLPTSKKFKRWVASSIRENSALTIQLAEEREKRLIAEQRINELTPKITYYDVVLANDSLVTFTTIAKDYGMDEESMYMQLHDLKVISKQEGGIFLLYAKHQKTGWTQSETRIIPEADGTQKVGLNTKWTQKGRLGLYELLKDYGILPLIERNEEESC